jgi:hypothetical protein
MSGICFLYSPDLVELAMFVQSDDLPPPVVKIAAFSRPNWHNVDLTDPVSADITIVSLDLLCSLNVGEYHWEAFYMQRS